MDAIPLGLCQCGCGQQTGPYRSTHLSRGHRKGELARYIKGHQPIVVGPVEPRFWAKVAKGGGCWLWQAGLNDSGYGSFYFNGEDQKAHRVSWQLAHGPVAEGLCVLHKCDTPACVRPDHLFLGTQLQNLKDMQSKGRARGRHSAQRRTS